MKPGLKTTELWFGAAAFAALVFGPKWGLTLDDFQTTAAAIIPAVYAISRTAAKAKAVSKGASA